MTNKDFSRIESYYNVTHAILNIILNKAIFSNSLEDLYSRYCDA